jgi:hypothetical protein
VKIRWIKLGEKKIPLRYSRVASYRFAADGKPTDTGLVYISHFIDCPDAESWYK